MYRSGTNMTSNIVEEDCSREGSSEESVEFTSRYEQIDNVKYDRGAISC